MLDDEGQRIIDASWRILGRSHFQSLKVRQVLQAANVSANAFYRRFPGKSDLMIALIQDEMTRMQGQLSNRLGEATEPPQRLGLWIEEMLAVAFDERRAARARMFLSPVLYEEQPAAMERLLRATLNTLTGIIADGIDSGCFRSDDPESDATAISLMVRGFALERLTGALAWPRELVVSRVQEFALRALADSAGSAGQDASQHQDRQRERIVTVDAPGAP